MLASRGIVDHSRRTTREAGVLDGHDLFAFFSACHFSEFVYNLPVLMRGGRIGVAYWPVLKGPMLRIFAIDAVLFVANLVAALLLIPGA